MDGTELTAIRTPAVTFVGLRALAAAAPDGFPEEPNVVVFGAGVQALNHLDAAAWAWPDASLHVVGRRPERVAALIEQAAERGLSVSDAGADVESTVRSADVIITVTTSSTPLFPGDWVADGALVAAVGQHGLDARELAPELILRSDVLVEGRASAQREAGDLIPARSAEEWAELAPPNLADAVAGKVTREPGRPGVYCGVGMSWEDLVLAQVAFSHAGQEA
jgi:ornithine cyclodeaminase